MNLENELYILSYYLNNFSLVNNFQKEYFQDEKIKKIISVLEYFKENHLKFSIESLFVYSSKKNIETSLEELQNIKDSFQDFSNIQYHIEELKNDYRKQVTSKELLIELTSKVNSAGFIEVKDIISSLEKIKEVLLKSNDNIFLDSNQLVERYLEKINDRITEENKKSMGFKCLDEKYTRPGAPGEISMTLSLRGTGKSAFRKNMTNNLLNKGIPVVVFSLEMSETSEMDRDISLRTNIPVLKLNKKPKESLEDERFKIEIEKFKNFKNYLFTDEPYLSIDMIDSSLYKAKEIFREKQVFKNNEEYMFVFIDVINMVVDFEDQEPRTILKCMDRLHRLAKKHNIHIHGIGQINETRLRGKTFKSPEDLDKYKPNLEDIYGGSAYAQRARVVNILHRPKFLKERFFPEMIHLWEAEPDILQFHCVKQNDGDLFLQEFVFIGETMRIVPFIKNSEEEVVD